MKQYQIDELVCKCGNFSKKFEEAYRCFETNHIKCKTCHKPFESLAKFKCASCLEPAINTNFYEFNLSRDYDEHGNLTTWLECEECSEY